MANGFFRAITQLPHEQIHWRVFLIIEMALLKAWELMRVNPRKGFDLKSALEDPITEELRVRLLDEVFKYGLVEGFDHQVFKSISREPKYCDYKSDSIDKMPDIVIELENRKNISLPSQDGLFIECKPVDKTHPVGQKYCHDGLIRFVRGDYAWAMVDAMMIGYVREGYWIDPNLVKALQKSKTIITLQPPTPCTKSSPAAYSEVTHITRHDRSFPYPESGEQATPIAIRHLWLKRE